MYTDRSLTCAECNATFTFSADEQQLFTEKGYRDRPRRCPDCRPARKASGQAGQSSRGGYSYVRATQSDREMHSATCAQCGKETLVPFMPSGGRPVYCRDCFASQRD
jgi:CxxC-x17-CxxC domain-containing protein